jgi:hypothetical protein
MGGGVMVENMNRREQKGGVIDAQLPIALSVWA